MDEFSTDKVTLQQIEALAVVDDHGAQEDTFFNLREWNRDDRNIRARLTSEKISTRQPPSAVCRTGRLSRGRRDDHAGPLA